MAALRTPDRPIARAARLAAWLLMAGVPPAGAQVYGVPEMQPLPERRQSVDLTPPEQPQRQGLRIEPSIGIEETLTSNANYDRGSAERRADIVTLITPGVRIAGKGAHSLVDGTIYVPIYLYARTAGDNNRILPDVHLIGGFDALDRHFFLDAGADVHREFLTPFGAQPISGVTNSRNEYTAQTYRITPSFRGELANEITYELRDLNGWARATNVSTALQNSYINEARASLSREPHPFGWGLDYDLARVQFESSSSQRSEIWRGRASYAPDPQLRLQAIGGYENDDYPGVQYKNAVYGVGIGWRPNERTTLQATWEHRFFGSSYHVDFDYRRPLSALTFRASRDVTSYPAQLFALRAGADVNALLNEIFLSRFPDAGQRQLAVNQIIENYQLPNVLPGPVNLFAQNVALVTDVRGTAALLGVRNTVYLTLFRQHQEAITPLQQQLSDFLLANTFTQTGGTVTWSSRLSPIMTLTGTLSASRTVGSETIAGIVPLTRNAAATLVLTTPISRLTDFHVGTRYQTVRSNAQATTDEAAVFVGIVHRFY